MEHEQGILIAIESAVRVSDNTYVVKFELAGPRRQIKHPQGFAVAMWSTRYRGQAIVGDLGAAILDGSDMPAGVLAEDIQDGIFDAFRDL